MNDIPKEAVVAAAEAIARVWTSENKNADIKQATALFEISAEAALRAAAPYNRG